MFGLSKPKNRTVQTPIGEGISEPDDRHGELLEVRRYHRGAVIDFSWHPSLPAALQVPEVAAAIQTYLDRALDAIDADEGIRAAVIERGGIHPISVCWDCEDCDFAISFAYGGRDDGVLRVFFQNGEIAGTEVSD